MVLPFTELEHSKKGHCNPETEYRSPNSQKKQDGANLRAVSEPTHTYS